MPEWVLPSGLHGFPCLWPLLSGHCSSSGDKALAWWQILPVELCHVPFVFLVRNKTIINHTYDVNEMYIYFWLLMLSFLKVMITDIQLELSKPSYRNYCTSKINHGLNFHAYTFCYGLSLGQESRQLVLPLLLWHHHHFLLHLVISWNLNKKIELVLLTKMLELQQFHYSILNKEQNFKLKLHMIIKFVQA